MPKGSFDLPAEDKAFQLIEYNFIMPISVPFPRFAERVFIMPEKTERQCFVRYSNSGGEIEYA